MSVSFLRLESDTDAFWSGDKCVFGAEVFDGDSLQSPVLFRRTVSSTEAPITVWGSNNKMLVRFFQTGTATGACRSRGFQARYDPVICPFSTQAQKNALTCPRSTFNATSLTYNASAASGCAGGQCYDPVLKACKCRSGFCLHEGLCTSDPDICGFTPCGKFLCEHGACQGSFCRCDNGWRGQLCSEQAEPPKLNVVANFDVFEGAQLSTCVGVRSGLQPMVVLLERRPWNAYMDSSSVIQWTAHVAATYVFAVKVANRVGSATLEFDVKVLPGYTPVLTTIVGRLGAGTSRQVPLKVSARETLTMAGHTILHAPSLRLQGWFVNILIQSALSSWNLRVPLNAAGNFNTKWTVPR